MSRITMATTTPALYNRIERPITRAIRSHLLSAIDRKFLLQISFVFIAYVIAGKLGQATANIRSSNLGPVWPAYGVALAAILICGYRVCLAIVAAAFVVALFSPVPQLAALGQAAGATIAATSGAFLLNRIAHFNASLSRLFDALSLIVIGGFGSAVVSASIGVSVLYLTHVHAYSGLGAAWLIYWLGDATGVLLVTPLALHFSDVLRLPRNRMKELAILLVLLVLTTLVIFGDLHSFPVKLDAMAFAVLPFIMWAAIRFGVGLTAVFILIVAGITTIETALGSGPFASNTTFMNAVLLDVFFGVLSVSGLSLAAVIVEREKAEHDREQVVIKQSALESRLQAAHVLRLSEENMSRKLIAAQEQERTRIARELHDDINQRLALLAVELEANSESVPDSVADTRLLLRGIRERINEISFDIQSLSHQLHSSQLEYLGIVGAARGFCRDLAASQKVEITFEHDDIPRTVSPECSLCVFRVLQEALHNAVKHSCVRHFEVRLSCSENQLQLTVSDSGVGFDRESALNKGGLGLISMHERVRLVNGTITIESKPMGGTIIDVRVPLESHDTKKAAG